MGEAAFLEAVPVVGGLDTVGAALTVDPIQNLDGLVLRLGQPYIGRMRLWNCPVVGEIRPVTAATPISAPGPGRPRPAGGGRSGCCRTCI